MTGRFPGWQNKSMVSDKFRLALAVIWTVVTIYFLLSLFPPLLRVHQRWEARYKALGRNNVYYLSWLQRFVFVLLTTLMTAHLYLDAFHRDFSRAIGIRSTVVSWLMISLPALFFLLPVIEKCLRRKEPS